MAEVVLNHIKKIYPHSDAKKRKKQKGGALWKRIS